MNKVIEKMDYLLELGGLKKDITFLVISGISLLLSIFKVVNLPFDIAWVAIILCGLPIIEEAFIGLVHRKKVIHSRLEYCISPFSSLLI